MIRILHQLCRSCDVCVAVCPHLALWMEGDRLRYRADRCRDHGACMRICPAAALIPEKASAVAAEAKPRP